MIDWLVRALARQPVVPPEPLPPGVAVRRGSWIPRIGGLLARMGRPAAAVTLGRTIIVHPDAVLTPRLLRHELMHVRQWQRDRLGFPFRYAWYHLRYGYGGNPYEIEARRAEQDDRPRT
ncbi:MAG: DUF4157 domain-containing protein [Gemmatimonadota bacterium]|jgi:hypothetical protein